jgi:small subunit ribosomal protein S11
MANKKETKKTTKKPMAKKAPTKKKKKKVIENVGVVHIHSTTNNTIISLTDEKGNVLA